MIVIEYSPILGMKIFTGFKEIANQVKVSDQRAKYQSLKIARRIRSKTKK